MSANHSAPTLSLWGQIWGSTFEKIHTLGTCSLALSLVLFLCFTPLSKTEAVGVFFAFGIGCGLIGWATLCNSWTRWRHSSDTLILLRRRHSNPRQDQAEIHVFGRSISWEGPLAHIDVGTFTHQRIAPDAPHPQGSLFGRSYRLFRAIYWAGCSSLLFQTSFGLGAFLYGMWLLAKVHTYMLSSA